MKKRLTSPLGFVAIAFLLATALTATAGIDELTKAKVVRIKGSARFTTGTGAWQPLKVGDVLNSGTVIQTAADSRVDLVLGDTKATASDFKVGLPYGSAGPTSSGAAGGTPVEQNFIRMMEDTVLSVDRLAATDTGADIVTDTQLDLRAGRIFGTVKKLSAGSRYEVKIPNGVAGIRGTVYLLSVLGELLVSDGNVWMVLKATDNQMYKWSVPAGFKFDPSAGEHGQIVPLSKSEDNEMGSNRSAAQKVKLGSYLFGPVPQKTADDAHLSPLEGLLKAPAR